MDKDQPSDSVVRFCEEQGIRLLYVKTSTFDDEGYWELSDFEILVEGNPG